MTPSTEERIRGIFSQLQVSQVSGFAHLVKANANGGCIFTPAQMMERFWKLSRGKLAAMLTVDSTRVRLRGGAFMSVVHAPKMAVVVLSDAVRGKLTPRSGDFGEDDAAIARALEERGDGFASDWRALVKLGFVGFVQGTSKDEEIIHSFVSSVAASTRRHTTVECTPTQRVIFIDAPTNTYSVLFGPRMQENFEFDPEVQKGILRSLTMLNESTRKRSRDGDDSSVSTRKDSVNGGGLTTHVDPDECLRLLQVAVETIISRNPSSSSELKVATSLSPFRDGGAMAIPNFDRVLQEVLRRCATYRGRKYHPRE
jgi:hypothetical protein